MARPIPRRRAAAEAPTADEYAPPTRRRGAAPAEEETPSERRPRAGRRSAPEPEPEAAAPRRRRSAPEPEPEPAGDDYPTSIEELDAIDDDDFNALVVEFDIPDDVEEGDLVEAVWDAIEATRAPKPAVRGRRGRASEPEEEPAPAARGRRGRAAAEDEDEKPIKRKPQGGFEGYKITKSKTFTGDFKLTPELLLAKFIDDGPFDSYHEHGLFNELKEGQRVWMGLDDDCPLCDIGHKGRAIALWNIVVLPEEGEPHLEVLKAGPMLSKEIEKKAALKTGPMSKEYYALAQPEQQKNEPPIAPIVELVRERDVKEEWAVDPFTDAELDEFAAGVPDPEEYVSGQMPTRAALKGIARKLVDG